MGGTESPLTAFWQVDSLRSARPLSRKPRRKRALINEQISKSWKDNNIEPAEPASDEVFLRRVFIDLMGRIPTAEEVKDYERDKSANKRTRLVARLLHSETYPLKDASGFPVLNGNKKPIVFDYSKEFAQHWAEIWSIWLMSRVGVHEMYHGNLRYWLEDQLAKSSPSHEEIVRKLLTATGKSNVNGAVAFIGAHLGEPTYNPCNRSQNPADIQTEVGKFDMIPLASRISRVFLGIQVQCTQCHDHPFNPELGQESFWGVDAFLRQVDLDRVPAKMMGVGKAKKRMEALPFTVTDNPMFNSTAPIFFGHARKPQMIGPTFLADLADLDKEKNERPRKRMPKNTNKTCREVLADYIIGHDNFAKAFINRMWGHFFGRGLGSLPAYDDFENRDNKVVHPELLKQLAQEFVKSKYDPKQLMEWICNSDVYNLNYVAPNEAMTHPDKAMFFG